MMKNVPGYDGKYQINECGVIINKNGHVMRTAVGNSGYLRTALEEPNSIHRKNESIHRLVAQTFIPNPDNLPVVMHLDNDKLNNHVSNLKWATQSENIQQAFDEGRKVSPAKISSIYRPSYVYKIYNEETGDCVICNSRAKVADTIGYAEISLKNMVGHDRGITQGAYKGYKIERTKMKTMCTIVTANSVSC